MKFGDQRIYEIIEANQATRKSLDDIAWNEVFNVVAKDIGDIISKKDPSGRQVSKEDLEDLIQDVEYFIVYKNVILDWRNFYRVYDTPQKRNSWLWTVVTRRFYDFWKKKKKILAAEIPEEVLRKRKNGVSDHAFDTPKESGWDLVPNKKINLERQCINEEDIYKIVNSACSLKSKPSHIMVFLLGCLSIGEQNADYTWVDLVLQGKTLGECYDSLVQILNVYLARPMPDDVMKPLKDKVDPVRDEKFDVEFRRYAGIVNDVRNSLKKKGEISNGGE